MLEQALHRHRPTDLMMGNLRHHWFHNVWFLQDISQAMHPAHPEAFFKSNRSFWQLNTCPAMRRRSLRMQMKMDCCRPEMLLLGRGASRGTWLLRNNDEMVQSGRYLALARPLKQSFIICKPPPPKKKPTSKKNTKNIHDDKESFYLSAQLAE